MRLLYTCFILFMCAATPLNPATAQNLHADIDTVFNTGSGIHSIKTDGNKVKILTNLGQLWGFIKYYHASVSDGAFNMDAALFRVLPQVLTAKTETEANIIMEQWVDSFGIPYPCTSCEPITKADDVKLMPDYGHLFDTGNFPSSLRNKLEYIRQNRSSRSHHYYIEGAMGVNNPVFRNEIDYADQPLPDAGIRLLALYRYWNMIQYFFPDRHLIGEDWSNVLSRLIPEFCNASDTLAYYWTCLHMICQIHDTHAQLWGNSPVLRLADTLGKNRVPLVISFIENKLAVFEYKDTLGIGNKIKKGDIIEYVNGVPVDIILDRHLSVTSASNYAQQKAILAKYWGPFLRTNDTAVCLDIVRNSAHLSITLPAVDVNAFMWIPRPFESDVAFKILPGGIGYIFPARLKEDDIKTIKPLMANKKGIIIDMRCYPAIYMPFSYGNWLKQGLSPFVKITTADMQTPGMFTMSGGIPNGCIDSGYYHGKVVIIVNSKTVSRAEYATIALSGSSTTTIIGDTTAGADGTISEIKLPGGYKTAISGYGVLYPDGSETQRVGVRIDKIIRPTPEGLAAGKDELLDAAIDIINKN